MQGVSQLKRYDTARRHRALRRRAPSSIPTSPRSSARRATTCPASPKVGEKTAVKWLGQFGTLDALLENADKITGVVGSNLREHLDDVAPQPHAQPPAARRRAAGRARATSKSQPMDAQAVRDIFARLEFRTLIPRVAELAGIEQQMAAVTVRRGRRRCPCPTEPAPRRARAPGSTTPTARSASPSRSRAALPRRIGFATADAAAEATWTPEVAAPLARVARLRRAEGLQRRQAAGQGAAPRRPRARRTRVRHDRRRLAAAPELPRQDPRRPRRPLPRREAARGRPDAARARDRGRDARPAVVVHAARRRRRCAASCPRASRAVLTDIELPTLLDARRHGARRRHRLARRSSRRSPPSSASAPTRIAQQAYAAIGREVNLGSPKQLQEVLFEELQHAEDPRDQDRLLDGCRASLADLQETQPAPVPRPAAAAPRGDQAAADHRVARQGDRRRRPHPHHLRADRQPDRAASSSTDPNLQNIPVRTEESRRIRAAFEVGEGYETLLTADYSQIEMRIMAHLSGDPGLIEAFNSGEDLHRFVGARVFGVEPAGRHRRRCAPRSRRCRTASSTGCRRSACRKQLRIEQTEAKQLMMEYFAPVRRGARLPALVGRAGEDRRLHRDDLRPPPAVPRPREPQPRAARERRARGAQRADPGQRRRHHEDRAVPHPRRLRRRAACARACCMQIHDELVFEVAPGEWDAAERDRPRRGWATRPTSTVPLDVQIGRGARLERSRATDRVLAASRVRCLGSMA